MLAIEDASVAAFASPWQDLQGNPGTPWSPAPAFIGGTCRCKSISCVGLRVTGWQFKQRGLWITFAASTNKVIDRACGSSMLEKAETALSAMPSAAKTGAAPTANEPMRIPHVDELMVKPSATHGRSAAFGYACR